MRNKKNMKDVFDSAFDKNRNYDHIISRVGIDKRESRAVSSKKLPKYTLAASAAIGAAALVFVVSKKIMDNRALKLETN